MASSNDAVIKTVRISVSVEMVVFDLLSNHLNQSVIHAGSKECSIPHDQLDETPILKNRVVRAAMVLLHSLKDKRQLAIRLQERDSQTVEQCKTKQRKYIANFRQRENGKFSAENDVSKHKIRAPTSFKQE